MESQIDETRGPNYTPAANHEPRESGLLTVCTAAASTLATIVMAWELDATNLLVSVWAVTVVYWLCASLVVRVDTFLLWGKWLGCVTVLGVLCLVLSPTTDCNMLPNLRRECANSLKQLTLALESYHNHHKTLPPAVVVADNGQPIHSWRTLILLDIDGSALFNHYRMNEPWNSQHNSKVTQANIEYFHCPRDEKAGEFDTSYVAIVGPNTAWQRGKGVQLRAIKDPSKTILLVELHNSGIKWAEPRDLDLDDLPAGITKENLLRSLSNHASGGFNAAFADGHVNFIPSTIPWKTFEAMLSIDGDKPVGPID